MLHNKDNNEWYMYESMNLYIIWFQIFYVHNSCYINHKHIIVPIVLFNVMYFYCFLE